MRFSEVKKTWRCYSMTCKGPPKIYGKPGPGLRTGGLWLFLIGEKGGHTLFLTTKKGGPGIFFSDEKRGSLFIFPNEKGGSNIFPQSYFGGPILFYRQFWGDNNFFLEKSDLNFFFRFPISCFPVFRILFHLCNFWLVDMICVFLFSRIASPLVPHTIP